MENLPVPGYFRGEKPGKGQEVCLQLCGVADKKWFWLAKVNFLRMHIFMFQKEESCDITRMHLYTRPSKSTITAEEWRMMWKCPVCRYENKITRFCLRCGYNGDHGQSPDAPAASGKGGCPAPQQEQNLTPVQWLNLAKQEQDPTKRIAYLKKAAELGNAEAQYQLGLCYYGRGTQEDEAQTVCWLRRAAEQGHAKAQYVLGVCCERGKGVRQDAAQTVLWYRKSAELGYKHAQYYLGRCYENGTGVTRDLVQAAQWYQKAARQGQRDAQFALAACYENGWGIKRSSFLAAHWRTKARNNNDV